MLLKKENGTEPLEEGLAVSYKGKQFYHMIQQSCITMYLPKLVEILCPSKTCTSMFTATLLIIAKNWKQLKCP